MAADGVKEAVQVVSFSLAKETYGISITRVQEINRLAQITKLPKVPAFMEGIVNLRGQVIPVIDLRKRFALTQTPYTEDTRIVVGEMGGQTVGMVVDAVQEVVLLEPENIEPPPVFSSKLNSVYGVGKQAGQLIILLDIDQILSDREEEALRQVNE